MKQHWRQSRERKETRSLKFFVQGGPLCQAWGAMGYLLLTGGTGLLGEYLVRDLLTRGTKLALLVRSSP